MREDLYNDIQQISVTYQLNLEHVMKKIETMNKKLTHLELIKLQI